MYIQHLPCGEVLVAGMCYKCDTLPLSLLYTLASTRTLNRSCPRVIAATCAHARTQRNELPSTSSHDGRHILTRTNSTHQNLLLQGSRATRYYTCRVFHNECNVKYGHTHTHIHADQLLCNPCSRMRRGLGSSTNNC